MNTKGRDFLKTYMRFYAILMVAVFLLCMLCACAGEGEPVAYENESHTHVYGHWCDAAPETEGAPITHEVRYCKICHTEDVRVKE